MVFTLSLYAALTICLTGTLFRIGRWFHLQIGLGEAPPTLGMRILAAGKHSLKTLISRNLFRLMWIFFKDILLQWNILRQSFWRWLMHICLFYGMVLLICMHALDDSITRFFFPDYESTLNPFFWLRNLFGLMVILGAGIAIWRRLKNRRLRLVSRPMDALSLALVALLIVSGILLEAAQIVSEPIFDEMVTDYMGETDEETLVSLKTYWASEFDLVFASPLDTNDSDALDWGRETHAEYCMSCHDRPTAAFISYGVARSFKPLAVGLNRVRADIWLWYLHFLVAFAGLAWLPFGKFFHLIATPVNLLAGGLDKPTTAVAAHDANRRALALDACTHCGICSLHCKVAPIYTIIPNAAILPSEKLAALKQTVAKQHVPQQQMATLAQGSHICTDCGGCTMVCPSGIDLQDLWRASKQDLIAKGETVLHHRMMHKKPHQLLEPTPAAQPAATALTGNPLADLSLSNQPHIFHGCIQCTVCTSVCPVVEVAEQPEQALDLTPQQIMNLLRLQLKDAALEARMVWKCVTCYMCQEHCPQGVRVADVLYELRNCAHARYHSQGDSIEISP